MQQNTKKPTVKILAAILRTPEGNQEFLAYLSNAVSLGNEIRNFLTKELPYRTSIQEELCRLLWKE